MGSQRQCAAGGHIQPVPTLRRANGSVVDFFCCRHTFLPDGRVLVAGSTGEYDKQILNGRSQDSGHGFIGIREVVIFDPMTVTWTMAQPMAHGRGYPTVIRLGDNTVLAAVGLDEQAQSRSNDTLERDSDAQNIGWTKTRNFSLPQYPHLFQLHDGQVFFTGGKMGTEGDSVPRIFDPRAADKCNQCASVILPPTQAQRVLIPGGGPEDPQDPNAPRGRATQRVALIDLEALGSVYLPRKNLNHERMHVNAVLLPDRSVIAVGGGVTSEASAQTAQVDPQGGREAFEAEIYDLDADEWTITAPATIARLYHSVALLLPDGRVLSAGGNPEKGPQTAWLPPDPLEEERLEIFSPPYLFKKPGRPIIQAAPREIRYGEAVAITTPQAADIATASLIAQGLTTHSFNSTQRLVDLPFVRAGTTLNATVPNDHTVAPSGWYILFLVDLDGVPSGATRTLSHRSTCFGGRVSAARRAGGTCREPGVSRWPIRFRRTYNGIFRHPAHSTRLTRGSCRAGFTSNRGISSWPDPIWLAHPVQ